jgi:hypothetical protein
MIEYPYPERYRNQAIRLLKRSGYFGRVGGTIHHGDRYLCQGWDVLIARLLDSVARHVRTLGYSVEAEAARGCSFTPDPLFPGICERCSMREKFHAPAGPR